MSLPAGTPLPTYNACALYLGIVTAYANEPREPTPLSSMEPVMEEVPAEELETEGGEAPVQTGRLPRPITTRYGYIDVKNGRNALVRHFKNRPRLGACPPEFRIPLILEGYLSNQSSQDDGTSVEFEFTIDKVTEPPR